MSRKLSIYNFNPIDRTKTKDQIDETKQLYKYYHFKYWCYQKAYKYFKRLNLVMNIAATTLIVTGTITGAVTGGNPVILGVISGSGLLVKTYSELKDYKKRSKCPKFAYTTYQKTLVQLRSHLRGAHFQKQTFIDEMRLLDDMIIDQCPLITKFEKKYNSVFLSE